MTITQEQIDALRETHDKLVEGMEELTAALKAREELWRRCCMNVAGYASSRGLDGKFVKPEDVHAQIDRWWAAEGVDDAKQI